MLSYYFLELERKKKKRNTNNKKRQTDLPIQTSNYGLHWTRKCEKSKDNFTDLFLQGQTSWDCFWTLGKSLLNTETESSSWMSLKFFGLSLESHPFLSLTVHDDPFETDKKKLLTLVSPHHCKDFTFSFSPFLWIWDQHRFRRLDSTAIFDLDFKILLAIFSVSSTL